MTTIPHGAEENLNIYSLADNVNTGFPSFIRDMHTLDQYHLDITIRRYNTGITFKREDAEFERLALEMKGHGNIQ